MVSIYGAEAGNLALKHLATGGVYVGGEIAPQIPPKLRDGSFMWSFAAKGRLTVLLEQILVHVILNDKTALFGAAHCARGRAAGAADMTESRRSPVDESG
jgi:glucokinase